MGKKSWKAFVVDAFSEELFGGNQAGVVLLSENEDFPEDGFMRKIAGELKHSETAFVKKVSRDAFHIRYFTPVEEVELCGHATIGAFWVLYEEGIIGKGSYGLITGKRTPADCLTVQVSGSGIWMDMASPRELYTFTPKEAKELYLAYGLKEGAGGMLPKIVNTGLSDIILPVRDRESLLGAVQDCKAVTSLSQRYQVVGVHMFCLSQKPGTLAECRNFAPLYGIPEESATGTANGALTFYLYGYGHTAVEKENVFFQGETMGKPSVIKSRLELSPMGGNHSCGALDKEGIKIKIGGRAVISFSGELRSWEVPCHEARASYIEKGDFSQ